MVQPENHLRPSEVANLIGDAQGFFLSWMAFSISPLTYILGPLIGYLLVFFWA